MSGIETRHFINNEFVESKSGKRFKLYNPANEELVAEICEAGPEDVDAAVDAAEKAFPAWSATSAASKAALLYKLCDALSNDKVTKELGELEGKCMGIPSSVYPQYAAALVGALKHAAQLTVTKRGISSINNVGFLDVTYAILDESYTDTKLTLTKFTSLKQPFGVVAGILPWNVPLTMFGFKVGPAVAAGNTIVIKTSEKTPLTALYLCKIIKEVGFPPGVINVVSGFGMPCGDALARHMKVRKISFTGSARTGKQIQKAAAESNLKNVTLELGGKSPAIVFEDADLEMAAKKCAFSMFRNSGQICAAQSRVYVQKSVAEKFIGLYTKAWKEMVTHGLPTDMKTNQGPVADQIQFATVMKFIEEAKQTATVKLGGNRVGDKGYFIEPTVFTDVKDTDRISREEVFGPVAVVHTFETEEEVLKRANDTEYGLSSSFYTKDFARAMRVCQKIEAGGVGVNCPNTVHFDIPFGGIKQSGLGRELGPDMLEPFLETKSVFFCYE